jgi:hypothetical protein
MRGPGIELAFKERQLRQEPAHPHVGVDAEFNFASVRRPTFGHDFDPEVALVGQTGVERRRFGNDGRVGPDPGENVSGAEAAVFLVGHCRHDHITPKRHARIDERLHRADRCGKTPLHVVRSAAVELAVPDRARKRLGHAVHADGVEMGVEHEAPAATGALEPPGHADASGLGLVAQDFKTKRASVPAVYSPTSASPERRNQVGLMELMRPSSQT